MKGKFEIQGSAGRRLPKIRAALWGCVLLLALAAPQALGETPDSLLRKNCLRLKSRFETLARRNSDPAVLSSLAAETTAMTWTLAAAHLNEAPEASAKWRARAEEFEKSWSGSRDWEARHLRALKIYYEALGEVARALADREHDHRLTEEIKSVTGRIEKEVAALGGQPDASLEKLAYSGGLVDLAAVIAISLSDGVLNRPAALIVQDVAEETQATRRRRDLHYRAKLAVLYAANIQGLTDLVFLLGRPAGPPLNRNLAEIQLALNKAVADTRLSSTLSLTWIAQTQASLPLAYWLATRTRPDDRG